MLHWITRSDLNYGVFSVTAVSNSGPLYGIRDEACAWWIWQSVLLRQTVFCNHRYQYYKTVVNIGLYSLTTLNFFSWENP